MHTHDGGGLSASCIFVDLIKIGKFRYINTIDSLNKPLLSLSLHQK